MIQCTVMYRCFVSQDTITSDYLFNWWLQQTRGIFSIHFIHDTIDGFAKLFSINKLLLHFQFGSFSECFSVCGSTRYNSHVKFLFPIDFHFRSPYRSDLRELKWLQWLTASKPLLISFYFFDSSWKIRTKFYVLFVHWHMNIKKHMHIDGTHTKNHHNNECISCHGNKCKIIFVFPIETYPRENGTIQKKNEIHYYLKKKRSETQLQTFSNIFASNIFRCAVHSEVK